MTEDIDAGARAVLSGLGGRCGDGWPRAAKRAMLARGEGTIRKVKVRE